MWVLKSGMVQTMNKILIFFIFIFCFELHVISQVEINIEKSGRFFDVVISNISQSKVYLFYNGVDKRGYKFKNISNDTLIIELSKPIVNFSEPVVWKFEGKPRTFINPNDFVIIRISRNKTNKINFIKIFIENKIILFHKHGKKWEMKPI